MRMLVAIYFVFWMAMPVVSGIDRCRRRGIGRAPAPRPITR